MCKLICIFYGCTSPKVNFLKLRLTFVDPITNAADDIFFYIYIFQGKQVDVSCES